MGTRQVRPSSLYQIHTFRLFYALCPSHQRPTKNLEKINKDLNLNNNLRLRLFVYMYD